MFLDVNQTVPVYSHQATERMDMADLLDVDDLAEIYKTTAKGIYTRRSRSPETLPPSFKLGGKVVWLRSTVDSWFKEQERVQVEAITSDAA